ncbi:MAG: RHS repeat-associated core domain-containing protein, partial [bacterium]|nr:RHS repeat-associated core domain-containing protein [bacterium]
LPESYQQQLELTVREAGGTVLATWSASWPDVYGRRLELAWPGATPADQALLDLYGGVFATPPYEVDLKPVLRLDGVEVAAGGAIGSAEDAVLVATLTPPSGLPTVVPFELRAGEHAVFAVDFGRTPQATIDAWAEALDSATEAAEQEAWGLALAAATYTRSLAGDAEQLALLRGLRRVQLGNVVLAVQRGGVSTAPDGTPLTFAIAPPAVDLGSMTLGLFPADGVPAAPEALVSTLELSGSQGSFLEGEALTAALGGEHLTAVSALTRAVREGQTLTRVDAGNVDAALAAADLGEDAEASVLAGVGSGKIAWIHQNQLLHETWDASGYVLEDPATGAGGYFVTYERLLTGLDADITFHSPQDLDVVTEPTSVVATIDSEHEIASWTLSYKAADGGEAVVLAGGSGAVTAETLARFDPTLLLNGLHDFVLTARDALGQTASKKISVVVDGQMKIGHFTLSFVDLAVPLSGLDIEIIRTYDSRDKQLRGFGVGWNLDIRQGSYRNNRPPGEGWQLQTGFVACDTALESKSHLTVVRLSDQEVYRFALRLVRGVPRAGGGCSATAEFEYIDGPLPGTTLAILGNDQVFQETQSSNRVLDLDTFATYEPQQVRLTTRDGRIFELDLNNGVTLVEDLNGNQLSITPAGITHSSGKAIVFERDAEGRIARIFDPLDRVNSYAYDAAGDLVSFTDRAGATTRFSYDGDHRLLDIEDARGVKPIRNEYNAEGRVVRHIDASGKVIELGHDLDNRRDVVTNRLGASRVMDYDSRGNLVREIDELENATIRSFDARENLLSETDPLGHVTVHTYSAADDLVMSTDPLGNVTSYTYNGRGQVLTVTDPRGGVTTSFYDGRGNLARTTNALGKTTSLTYDTAGNTLTRTGALGHVTTFEYDSFGNQTKETDALGNETVSTYDGAGNRLTETRTRTLSDGSTEILVSSFIYDDVDRVAATIEADGTSNSTDYDALGQVIRRTDALGRVTTMTYDLKGRLVTTEYPDSTAEGQGFDAEDRLVTRSDRAGRSTTLTYDAVGRLLTTTFSDGTSTTRSYDAAGQLVATTDALGNTMALTYDEAGRQTAVVDPLGNTRAFSYDASGNQVATTDARGNTTTFTYDALNRRIAKTYPDGTATQVVYDDLGRNIAHTDQAGLTNQFGYDGLGRLTAVTDALSQATLYTYDEVGNRINQSDVNGHETRFEHDARARLVKRILPDGAVETMTYNDDAVLSGSANTDSAYNASGTLASHTDMNGATRTFQYDTNQRPVRIVYDDGSEFTFTYTPTGRRATATDARGTTRYAYDARDRLIQKNDPNGHQLSYTYDAQGNRASLTAIVGTQSFSTTYSYDALNRLSAVNDSQGSVTTLAYDANGNRTTLDFPNGVTTSYIHNSTNRLTDLSTSAPGGNTLQSYAYSLGPAGNRIRIDEQDGTSRRYQYDSLYRLVQDRVISADTGLLYQRDFVYGPVGNRLSQTIEDGEGTMAVNSTYDNRDRLLSSTTVTYDWDAVGNLTGRTGVAAMTYGWNHDNRLTSVILADGSEVETAYDADGNRVQVATTPPSGPAMVVDYLVDTSSSLSHVVAEIVDGQVQTLYTRADDQLIGLYRPSSGDTKYFHADGLGSVRVLSNEPGAVTDRYTYTAFGKLLEHSGSDVQPYQFAGEPYDPNTGFYYNRARWLDVEAGRFISVDPFPGIGARPATLHRYLYSENKPTFFVDPSGRSISLPQIAFAVALLGFAAYALFRPSSPPPGSFSSTTGKLGTCTDGRAPKRSEITKLTTLGLSRLSSGEFRVIGKKTSDYNCIALTISVFTRFVWDEVDQPPYGNKNTTPEVTEFNKFYAAHGLTPGGSTADAKVILYAQFGIPQHAAREYFCASGERFFESKLGRYIRIVHRPEDLIGPAYGEPVEYYN